MGLLEYLKEKQETDMIITGLQTDYCIDASVKSAYEHGFNIITPANANTTVDNDYTKAKESYYYNNQFMWPDRYAKCLSIEETIKIMKGRGINA